MPAPARSCAILAHGPGRLNGHFPRDSPCDSATLRPWTTHRPAIARRLSEDGFKIIVIDRVEPEHTHVDAFVKADLSDALAAVAGKVTVLDYRKKFHSPAYFTSYLYPSDKYFRALGADLKKRGLIGARK